MHYLVYIDVLFMVNFIMDYIVVSLAADIIGCRFAASTRSHKKRRIDPGPAIFCLRKVCAASIGALWVSIVLVLRLRGILWDIVTYFVIAIIMTMSIVSPREWRRLIKCMVVMYFVTCALGGIMNVVYYYTAFGCMIKSISEKPAAAAILPVLGGAVMLAPLINLIFRYISGFISTRKIMPVVIIENNGKAIRLKALVDTGNSLTDPYSGSAVNVMESDVAATLIKSYADSHYHLIPFMSLGEEKGLIPVVRFDRLTIIGEKKYTVDKPLFALYSGKFTDSDYRVILHPELIQDKTQRS
ncbi:MAG: sigma-E processing peptidase SpoIIGA [Butyrivibrio sp.]